MAAQLASVQRYEARRERERIAALPPELAKFARDMRDGKIPMPSAPSAPDNSTIFKLRLGPTLLGRKGLR